MVASPLLNGRENYIKLQVKIFVLYCNTYESTGILQTGPYFARSILSVMVFSQCSGNRIRSVLARVRNSADFTLCLKGFKDSERNHVFSILKKREGSGSLQITTDPWIKEVQNVTAPTDPDPGLIS